MHFVLSGGGHPFGNLKCASELEAQVNIIKEANHAAGDYKGTYPLPAEETTSHDCWHCLELPEKVVEGKAAEDLIKQMIAKDKEDR